MEFKRLNDFREERTGKLLLIRTDNARLEKMPEKTLIIESEKNPEIMTNSKERKEHFEKVIPEWFKERIQEWEKSEFTESQRIAPSDNPLEIITGDTCLILEIEGKQYTVEFYRDIYPQGWLIPGGCPRNLEEIFNPEIIASREVKEEVLIGDREGKIYSLGEPGPELEDGLQIWKIEPKEIIKINPEKMFLGTKGDAQNLILKINGREERIKKINIFIDSQLASVCATFYWKLKLPIKLSELRLFDGERKEKDKSPINRPIRLIDIENKSVAAIFIHGQNILSAGWITLVAKKRSLFV